MEKIKIVHISETFVSGVYTYIKQLSEYSESNGNFKNYIIYSGERSETNESLLKEDFSPQTELIRIDMTREISLFRDFIALFQIVNQIRKIKPDVIHVHSSKAGVLGRVASVFCPKAKLFYTPHSYSFIRTDITKVKRKFYLFVEKTITKIFGGVIVACGDQEFAIAKKLGKAVLIRNGIDLKSLSKYRKEHKNNVLTIGTCGRIYYQKNPDLFNEIALQLPEYNFIWIGDGDIKNKLVAKNITITGWYTRDETLVALNDLDIFISTSLWEGLPFNILEAMALSKPIVSSNIEGNKVTVSENKNGYICDSLADFVASIKKLENQEKRNSFGNESSKIADTLFNIDKNVLDLINLYQK